MAVGRHLDDLGLSSESFSAQGSSRSACNVRRAVVLAALVLLSATAAIVLNREETVGAVSKVGVRELVQEKLWSSRFTRTVIGQRSEQTASSQELLAAESGSAAAADAAKVVSSEAAGDAPASEAPAAEQPQGEVGMPAEAIEGEQPMQPPSSQPQIVEAKEGMEGGIPRVPNAQLQSGAPTDSPYMGYPFPSAATENMIEHPVDVGPNSQYEFPPGVVYSGPPVNGAVVGPRAAGHIIVNMAGIPHSGTAVVEEPEDEPMGIPGGLMKALINAARARAQPAADASAAGGAAEAAQGVEGEKEEVKEEGGDEGAGVQEGGEDQGAGDEEGDDRVVGDEGSEEKQQVTEGEIREAIADALGVGRDDERGEMPLERGYKISRGDIPVAAIRTEAPVGQAEWSYGAAWTGPAHWGSIGYPTCSTGQLQSPVNVEQKITPAELPTLAWQIPQNTARRSGVVVFADKALEVQGYDAMFTYDGVEYLLERIVSHTPSEHTFGGQHYPMELQFVHKAMVQGVPKYLIISSFMRSHAESCGFVHSIAEACSKGLDSDAKYLQDVHFETIAMTVLAQMEPVNPSVTNAQNYYQYQGSMTAPPCEQGVTWLLLKNSLPITERDLAAFVAIQGSNNRPVQSLGDRTVFDSHVLS